MKSLASRLPALYVAGLVDSPSEEEFLEKFETKKDDWLKRKAHNTGVKPGLFEWFIRYKVEMFTSGMLQPMREDAGLGWPPAAFTILMLVNRSMLC